MQHLIIDFSFKIIKYLMHNQILNIYRFMINKVSGAKRLVGFDKPTVWSIMTPLAVKTKSMNLGQGFPSWSPPNFYLQNLNKAQTESQHQYTRAYGSLPLVQAIANYHKRFPKLDAQNQIVTVNGGVQGLFCSIIALVDEGDQVVFFDPSYDCYRAQIQMAGGRSVGLPLKPKHQQSKTALKQRCKDKYFSSQIDDWQVDFQAFQKSLNQKTKMFILNSPHNPCGKVFTNQQLARMAKILQKYPRVIVVQDNVYQGMTFDDMFQKQLPKMAFQQGFQDRTLSVYSAGKIFAATGVRSGWVIGNPSLIRSVRSVHQYNVFCAYNVIQNTIAKSLQQITKPQSTYMKQYAQKLTKHRNILLDQLIASKFDIDLWVPKGGYFVIADISRCEVKQKYYTDEQGNKRTKDYAFCFQLAHEEGVVAIPCSPFYSKEDAHLGEQYVRFAFCKDEQMIREGGKRLR